MAYEISSSVANGTFSFQNVTASNAVDFNSSGDKKYPTSGQPSPNGDKIAVPTRFAGGATAQSGVNHGIDIYHSSSGGWTRQETIETEGIPSIIQWRAQDELWYYGEDVSGSTNITMLWYRTSGSSGWSDPKLGAGKTNGLGRLDNPNYFIFNQQKDLIIAWEGTISGQDETRWAMYYSGSQTSTNDGMWDGMRFVRSSQFGEYGVTQCVAGPRSGDAQTLFLSDENTGRVWSHEVDLSGWTTPDGSESSVSTNGSDFTVRLNAGPFATEFPWITDNYSFSSNTSNGKLVNKSEGTFGGLLYWHSASNNILVQSSPGATVGSPTWSAFNGSNNFKLYLYTSGSTGWFDNEQEILSGEVKPFATTQAQGLQPGYDENRIFYGTDGMDRDGSKAWRGGISCLESGSEGWKITKDIHYPMISQGPGFIGYSSTLLVVNTTQPGLTNPVSGNSHALTLYTDLDDATFSVAALPSPVPPSFTLTPSDTPLSLTEGSTGTVGVVLGRRPTSDVVISISLANSLSGRASLSTSTLTFTNSNWDTQQDVTVTAASDNIDNDDATGDITFSVVDASSDDDFDALADQTVTLTVVDNDTAGFNLSPNPPSLNTTELGGSAVLTVRLATEPLQDVTVTCTSPLASEGSMLPEQVEFTFTSLTWNDPQTITFTGVEDNILDGDQTYTVELEATSDDPRQNFTQTVTITNTDSRRAEQEQPAAAVPEPPTGDPEDPEDPEPDGGTLFPDPPEEVPDPEPGAGGTPRRSTKKVDPKKNQADMLPRKLHFEASTIETIDKSVLNYLLRLNLFADSNEGWRRVPVIWGTAERAYQVKHNKEIRDAQGMLKLPIISVKRNSLVKDMPSRGVFQGTSPEVDKLQGGALAVGRVIYQEKSSKFASADALKLHKQSYFPRPNPKTVYKTVVAPMPVNVTVMYEFTIRTEYQQQMNNLILPFVTTPGTINYITLVEGEHRFEGFIQGDFQNNDNLANFSGEERKFETKIQLKVVGYLVGEENNRQKPHYAIKENAVEVKIPRERLSLREIPEHEYGAYYGLEGVPKSPTLSTPWAPFFFSNVPAVGAGYEVASSSTGGSEGPGTGDYVTSENFAVYLAQNMVIRELLKGTEDAAPNPANVLNVATAVVRAGTESVYLNGAQLTYGVDNDYTMNGQQITLNFDLIDDDVITVTYIKQ